MIGLAGLSLGEIRRGLRTEAVGGHIFLYGEVDSTNARCVELARAGASHGTVVLADAQTAGRGRQGRAWFSPPGVNAYISVLLRPRLRARDLGVFSLIASLALADAVRDFGGDPAIKWPNDVLVDGKKIGGALGEALVHGDAVQGVVLGVGVNLKVDRAALAAALGPTGAFATSLAAVTGREVDRNAFVAAYLNHLEDWVRVWDAEGPEAVLTAWKSREILTGRRVQVREPGGTYQGRAVGITEAGALVVEDTLGRRHVLTEAEVRLLD